MKKFFLFLLVLLGANCASAQNWQCLQDSVIRHYTGPFVRGMKIDSVKQVNSDVVFYPYRTIRGVYLNSNGSTIDSNGGSWLGKEVWLKPDGEMLFDTYWGDTVFIKTRAAVGDSWIFYNDTSSRYYMATVMSADTATVLGVLDSIKTIKITAFSNGQPNTTDLVHNQNIIISKDHGFYKTFSVYMFPFHAPEVSGYQFQQDYILDKRDVINGSLNSYTLFKLFMPLSLDDYEVGDVFQYWTFGIGPYSSLSTDSVISKTPNGQGGYSYQIYEWRSTYNSNTNTYTPGTYIVTSLVRVPLYIDTNAYEESDLTFLLDTHAFCDTALYVSIGTNFWAGLAFEPCYSIFTYMQGFGQIAQGVCNDPSGAGNYTWNLSYSRKSGLECGNYYPVNIHSTHSLHPQVFPNPTTGTVRLQAARPVTIAMYDVYGRLMTQTTEAQQQQEISLHQQPAGIYTIRCVADDGVAETVKVVKE